MNRTRDYYRKMRKKHINKKKRISSEIFNSPYYKCDGKYSKGKIHCSCPLCSCKTKTSGYKASEARTIEKISYQDAEDNKYEKSLFSCEEEIDYDAAVDGVYLDGVPLDGHSLLESLFDF